ncbi:COMPASS (complex proteins associated with Set1p) component [Podospora pseudocomata]|uniref:COMPASS (Complex proteins associated with Set1p) component n=1 Tax=Podospora pseudocomata TaxID=2093779 RepID=A0ABR0GXB0_9PEZI|nr:COMPASS (complex proteins associated with Set1p) component [Podospora pseudocomata]
MADQQQPPLPEATNGLVNPSIDTPMTDAPSAPLPPKQQQQQQQQQQPPPLPHSSTPTPRTTTPIPLPHIPGFTAPATASNSRATSVHPPEQQATVPPPTNTTAQTTTIPMPSEPPLHGAPVRQYINSKITGVLLEGMKLVAREQPKDPLRVLGEYLLQRSNVIEQQGGQKGE